MPWTAKSDRRHTEMEKNEKAFSKSLFYYRKIFLERYEVGNRKQTYWNKLLYITPTILLLYWIKQTTVSNEMKSKKGRKRVTFGKGVIMIILIFHTKIRSWGYRIQVAFKWSMLLRLFLDNTRPAMSKTSLCFSKSEEAALSLLSLLYLLENLLGKKSRGLWLMDFDPFCLFLCFKERCSVFWKVLPYF